MATHAAAAGATRPRHNRAMWLLIVEAFIALALLVFVVWWTMFQGRPKGEPSRREDAGKD